MKLLTIAVLAVLSTPSWACLCWNDSFPLSYLKQNDTLAYDKQYVIIKGIAIDTKVGSKVYHRWGHGNLANIRVLEFWPKDANLNDTITIMSDDADCSSWFSQDSTYLIGAWGNRYLSTSQCEGTDYFSQYKHLVGQLGEPGVPKTKSYGALSKPSDDTNHTVNRIWIIGFGISLLLNIVLLIWRRKNKPEKVRDS